MLWGSGYLGLRWGVVEILLFLEGVSMSMWHEI